MMCTLGRDNDISSSGTKTTNNAYILECPQVDEFALVG
jgi:hypothetical protein